MKTPFSAFCLFITALLLCLTACDKPAEIALAKLERENFKFTAEDFVRAAAQGDDINVENFINAGIDVNTKNPEGNTALIVASERGHIHVVNRLLNAGANVNQQGVDNWSALMFASNNNQVEIVKALLDAGADANLVNSTGWTPLMQAAYLGYDRIVKILIPHTTKGPENAFLLAAQMGHYKVSEILLDNDIDINTSTSDGETALMLAAQKGRTEVVELLLERGVLKSVKNNIGETAAMAAKNKGFNEIALLIEKAEQENPDPAITPSETTAETAIEETTSTQTDAPTAATTAKPIATDASPTAITPATSDTAEAQPEHTATAEQTQPLPQSTRLEDKPESEEAWFSKYNLDLNDPTMLDADPDNDGFSNRLEYLANTNPHDPNSFPARATLLTLADTSNEQLPIVLEEVQGNTATIRRTDGKQQTYRVSSGEKIPNLPYIVTNVRKRMQTDKTSQGELSDVSETTIRNTSSGQEITLVRGLSARVGSGTAMLHLNGQGQMIKVKQGEVFSLPNDNNRKYQVLDIRTDQVILADQSNGETFTVSY